jgi:predicted ATP-grasp superfamily ATP-dependent carboligase
VSTESINKITLLSQGTPYLPDLQNALNQAGFDAEIVKLKNVEEIKTKALELYEQDKAGTWLVFSDDDDMYQLSRMGLTQEQQSAIFPTRKHSGLQFLGSKAGFTRFCNEHEISHPYTLIVDTSDELKSVLSNYSYPLFVKGERGGGGASVFILFQLSDADQNKLAEKDYPAVVQVAIESPLISVEAFYSHGQLVAWMYSEELGSISKFGPNYARTYLNPKNQSFIPTLQLLGFHAGLHGFVNCGLLRDAEGGYLLFEADLRPNAWHYLFHHFGIDLKSAVASAALGNKVVPLFPVSLSAQGIELRLRSREILMAMQNKDLHRYMQVVLQYRKVDRSRWVQGAPDSSGRFIAAFKLVLMFALKVVFDRMPARFIAWAKSRRLSGRIVWRLLG